MAARYSSQDVAPASGLQPSSRSSSYMEEFGGSVITSSLSRALPRWHTQPTMVRAQGISLLFEPSDVKPELDIIFIHGFTGHPRSTWTLDKRKAEKRRKANNDVPSRNFPSNGQTTDVYWPKDLVPTTLPSARVLTFGYDTKIRHFSRGQISKNTVQDHAQELLEQLRDKRRSDTKGSRPLVFIAHSLGGLVVREALTLASQYQKDQANNGRYEDIFGSTVAIIFFGTPHRGADPRSSFHRLLSGSALRLGVDVNVHIVDALMPNVNNLQKQLSLDDFKTLAAQRGWVVYTFQEEYGVSSLFSRKVVEDHSSLLGRPVKEIARHIADNHMDMCRFYGLKDPQYEKVAGCLQEILMDIRHPDACQDHPFRAEPELLAPDVISEDYSMGIYGQDASAARPLKMDSRLKLPLLSPVSRPTVPLPDHFLKKKKEGEQKLVESLRFDQLGARFLNISATHGITCQWFLSEQEYDDCQKPGKHNPNSWFLWIKGKPGTGKSTLMKYLHSTRRRKQSPGIVLSFFFNARGSQLEQSTIGCYRALLYTLLHSREGLWPCLDHLGSTGTGYILKNDWTVESLTQTFALAVQLVWTQLHQPIEIWIDALDECDENEVRKMISFFEDLADLADHQSIDLKICFASRHYPSITSVKGIDVVLERQEKHNEDIARYIEAKLHIGAVRADEIKAELLRKCSGIFLWVVLVVDILNREYARGNVMALGKRLDEIPADLHSVFESILTKDNKDMDETIRCLQILLYSTRPLKPPELFVATIRAMEPESSLHRWDVNEPPMSPEDLQRWVDNASRGLAQVTRPSSLQHDHDSHQRSGPKSERTKDNRSAWGSSNDNHGREITEADDPVAEICEGNGLEVEEDDPWTWETEQDSERDTSNTKLIMQMPPPPTYLSGLHSIHAPPPDDPSDRVRDFVVSQRAQFPRRSGPDSETWHLYESDWTDKVAGVLPRPLIGTIVADSHVPRRLRLNEPREQTLPRRTGPHKVRLDYKYIPTVQFIYESVRDFLLGKSSTKYQWTGLSNFGAFGTAHEMLKDLCMDHILAADPLMDSPDGFEADEYPFVTYAIHNLFAHAERACEVGISQDRFFQIFPLTRWLSQWHTFEVSTVETTTIDGTSITEYFEDTPHLLHLLAMFNTPNLIRAHPDSHRQFRQVYTSDQGHIHMRSPWETAIITHSFEALRELVNVTTTDPSAMVTLEEVRTWTKELRDRHYIPTKVELTTGGWCKTAILLSSFGHGQLLESFLLQIGEVECRCGIRKNLDIPRRCENNLGKSCLETIRQIVNQHDSFGRTALFYVTTKEMGELLLAYGADPRTLESQLYEDETALHFALRTDNMGTLRFLNELHLLTIRSLPVYQPIDSGRAHGLQNNCNREVARQRDVSHGHSQESLKKIDPDIKDGIGLTPLCCAVQLKNEAMVEFLLDGWPELDPNIPDDRGMTPLSWAIVANENSIVELLITRCPNVNPNTTIPDGLTPLGYAVALRLDSIVQLLITHCPSLDSSLPDIEGRTPLSWAAHGFQAALPSPKMIGYILTDSSVVPDQQDLVGKTPLRWAAEAHGERQDLIISPGYLNQLVTMDENGFGSDLATHNSKSIRYLDGKIRPSSHDPFFEIRQQRVIPTKEEWPDGHRGSTLILSRRRYPSNLPSEQEVNDFFEVLRLLLATKNANPFREAADGLSPYEVLCRLPTTFGLPWDEKARSLWLEVMDFIAGTWPSNISETFHQDLHQVKSTPIQVQASRPPDQGKSGSRLVSKSKVLATMAGKFRYKR